MASTVAISWKGERHASTKEKWSKQTQVIVEEVATLLDVEAADIWRGPHSWTRNAASNTVSADDRHITALLVQQGKYYKAHIYVDGTDNEAPANIVDAEHDRPFLALWDPTGLTWVPAAVVDDPVTEVRLSEYALGENELNDGYDSEASVDHVVLDAGGHETPVGLQNNLNNHESVDDNKKVMEKNESAQELPILPKPEDIVTSDTVLGQSLLLSSGIESQAMRKFYQMFCSRLSEATSQAILQGNLLPAGSDEDFRMVIKNNPDDTEHFTLQILVAPNPRHTTLKKDAGLPVANLRIGPSLSNTAGDAKLFTAKLAESWLKGVALQPRKGNRPRLSGPETLDSPQKDTKNEKDSKAKRADRVEGAATNKVSKTKDKSSSRSKQEEKEAKSRIASDGDDEPILKTDVKSEDPLLEAIQTLSGHTAGLKESPNATSKRRAELLARSSRQLRKNKINDERIVTGLEGKITLGKEFCGSEDYNLHKHKIVTAGRPVMEWSIVCSYSDTKKSSMKVALTIKGLSTNGTMKFTLSSSDKAGRYHEVLKDWSAAAGWDSDNKVDEKVVVRGLAQRWFNEAMADGRVL